MQAGAGGSAESGLFEEERNGLDGLAGEDRARRRCSILLVAVLTAWMEECLSREMWLAVMQRRALSAGSFICEEPTTLTVRDMVLGGRGRRGRVRWEWGGRTVML
jgi:hypothetical protein